MPHSSGSSSSLPRTSLKFSHSRALSATYRASQDDQATGDGPRTSQTTSPLSSFQGPASGLKSQGLEARSGGHARARRERSQSGQKQRHGSGPRLKVFEHGVWEPKKPASPMTRRQLKEQAQPTSLTFAQWKAQNRHSANVTGTSSSAGLVTNEDARAFDGRAEARDQHSPQESGSIVQAGLEASNSSTHASELEPPQRSTSPDITAEDPKPVQQANISTESPGFFPSPSPRLPPQPRHPIPRGSPTALDRMKLPNSQRNVPQPAPVALRRGPADPRKTLALLNRVTDHLREGRASDTLPDALEETDLHHTTRHLGQELDFAHLPLVKRFRDEQARVVGLAPFSSSSSLFVDIP